VQISTEGGHGQKPVHEGVQALVGLFLPLVGEVRERIVVRVGVPQGALAISRGSRRLRADGGRRHASGDGCAPSLWSGRPGVWLDGRRPGHWSDAIGEARRRLLGVIAPGWTERARWGDEGFSRSCGAARGSRRAKGPTGPWRPCREDLTWRRCPSIAETCRARAHGVEAQVETV